MQFSDSDRYGTLEARAHRIKFRWGVGPCLYKIDEVQLFELWTLNLDSGVPRSHSTSVRGTDSMLWTSKSVP
jgi:hypothetical protein